VRVSSYSQRQQTKWLVFGLAGIMVLFFLYNLIGSLFPGLGAPDSPFQLVSGTITAFYFLIVPLSVGIAIQRSRLWDIDLLINRTLVYGTLTVILTVAYVSLILGLQALLHGFISQDNSIAIVISTLAIAALFQPLRACIQRIIDRRFYRSKYNAAKIIEAFSATLRTEVDLNQLSAHLVSVVEETMQPSSISLWLRQPERRTSLWDQKPLE
jgi:divalent metal cation (Fe/Co/Zn/Cd) transporter